jgi:ABC-type multidrug transport system fused ATPase/permease subunit
MIVSVYLSNSLGFLTFALQLLQKLAAYTAGRKLHWMILLGVLHAPLYFFDTTPIGRIINRFAKDIDSVDSTLPGVLSHLPSTLITVIATFIILIYGSWFAIIECILLLIVFVYIQVKMIFIQYISTTCALDGFLSVYIYPHLDNFVVSIQLHVVRSMQTSARQLKVSAQFELIMHNNVSLMRAIILWTEISRAI